MNALETPRILKAAAAVALAALLTLGLALGATPAAGKSFRGATAERSTPSEPIERHSR